MASTRPTGRPPAPQPASPAPAAAEGGRPDHAWRSRPAVAVFAGAFLVGLAADLLTKHLVFADLIRRPGHADKIIPNWLHLRLSTNAGIVFGLPAPGWLVALATVGAVVAVAALFATSSRRHWPLHLALAMVLAGAAGNAYDRLFSYVHFPGERLPRVGQVRDFIDLRLIDRLVGYPWPVFNIADVLLVVGVGMIMVHTWRHRQEPAAGPRAGGNSKS